MRVLGLMALAASILAVASEAVAAGAPAAARDRDRELVAARVASFWAAWQGQDLHAIYLLYSPSYRQGMPEPVFAQTFKGITGVTPVSYTIDSTEFSHDGREVTLVLDAITVVPGFGRTPSRLRQRWGYEAGQWYRLKDPPEPPPVASARTGSGAQPRSVTEEGNASATAGGAKTSPSPRPEGQR